jgi:ATP-dependent DNA ligase
MASTRSHPFLVKDISHVRPKERWPLKPKLVGQFDFAEWDARESFATLAFIALREDKNPREVRKEA